jgi:hypothetical protein
MSDLAIGRQEDNPALALLDGWQLAALDLVAHPPLGDAEEARDLGNRVPTTTAQLPHLLPRYYRDALPLGYRVSAAG